MTTEQVSSEERAEWLESKRPHHRPNPAQPERCPSMDPYDGGLQCGRKIHDDDQCQFGGIGWVKGEPRKWSPDEDFARRLLRCLEAAEVALAALGRERNTWARQIADVRGELATAKEDVQKADAARAEAEGRFDRLRVDIEELLDDCDQWTPSDHRAGVYVDAVRRLVEDA